MLKAFEYCDFVLLLAMLVLYVSTRNSSGINDKPVMSCGAGPDCHGRRCFEARQRRARVRASNVGAMALGTSARIVSPTRAKSPARQSLAKLLDGVATIALETVIRTKAARLPRTTKASATKEANRKARERMPTITTAEQMIQMSPNRFRRFTA